MPKQQHNYWEFARFALAGVFLWGFFDKVFGLGYATPPDRSWLAGASPTAGFLTHGTSGPLASVFQSMAGNPFVDWLFMLGLLGVGTALLLGMGTRVAAYSGALMMALIYLSGFPPQNNPVLDEHIVYIIVLFGLKNQAGYWYGLREWWRKTHFVKQYPILE